jgi:hypothetical protein
MDIAFGKAIVYELHGSNRCSCYSLTAFTVNERTWSSLDWCGIYVCGVNFEHESRVNKSSFCNAMINI